MSRFSFQCVCIVLLSAVWMSGCASAVDAARSDLSVERSEVDGKKSSPEPAAKTPEKAEDPRAYEGISRTTESGLIIRDVRVGKGYQAGAGMKVRVHYVGRLLTGKKFDSSRDREEPFEFMLGRGNVIRGWDEGVQGMRVGGRRILIVPPELGYGSRGAGENIPPHATLKFDVELLGIAN